MRRLFPVVVAAALLAACTSDGNSVSELSIYEFGADTEVPINDRCAIDGVAGSDVVGATPNDGPATSDALNLADSVPGVDDSVPAAETGSSTEPAGSEPFGSEPLIPSSEAPMESTPPGPYDEAPDASLPTDEPSDLERTFLQRGPETNRPAGDGDIVLVYYRGVLSDTGEEFDSNYGTGSPFSVTLGPTAGVIEGWNEGLHGVRTGDQIQLDIPSELAYGEAGSGDAIPPDAALTFVIDVVKVVGIDWPQEEPTELTTTFIEHGDEDGRAVQWFDNVTINFVLGIPEGPLENPAPSGSEVPGGSEVPTGSEVPGDSIPGDESGPGEVYAPETEPPTTEATEPMEPLGSTPADSGVPSSEPGSDDEFGGQVIGENFSRNPQTGMPGQPLALQVVRGATGIDGLEQGLIGLRPGDVVQLDIPSHLALGETGSPDGSVPPNATLSMYVEVIEVSGPPLIEVPDEVPTELTVTELEAGTGPKAETGDTLLVNYVGVITESNTRVTSNWDNAPEAFVLGDDTFIPGWEEGLVGAQAGQQIQLDIPANEAYPDGVPDDSIPADEALSFVVQVVGVVPATAKEDTPLDIDLPLSSEPSAGIGIDDVVVGDGAAVAPGDTAVVNLFAVCASNGAIIQNTWGENQREFIPMQSGAVIEGLVLGLEGMQVGGTRVLTVPSSLAFADKGSPELGIGPDREIIFVVELYGVIATPTA